MSSRILIVDDDTQIRQMVCSILERSQYQTLQAESAEELENQFDGPQPDVVLLDLVLPDANGLDLLLQIKRHWPETEVIVLTGHATFDAAVEATKRGAYHFQNKPFDRDTLLLQVGNALEHKRLQDETSALRQALSNIGGPNSAIFYSAAMKSVLRTVDRVAPSDVSVLLTGESGTGKEVVTDLIHARSSRSRGPLVKINCAALPRELIESELFGSIKGAYTGATVDREGLFRQANGGTLMLDEISEMPVDTQSKLLRVLQEKQVRPVGGRASFPVDCRIVAATNRPVDQAIRDGKLREDLYYRIGAISIDLPPLRERREDILPLARLFLKRYAAQAGRVLAGFSSGAQELLQRHDWPGNVRQLQNEVQRAVLMCEGKEVGAHDLSVGASPAPAGGEAESNLTLMQAMERNTIVQMLKETGGNKLETAKRLGIGRQTLYNKLRAYEINA